MVAEFEALAKKGLVPVSVTLIFRVHLDGRNAIFPAIWLLADHCYR